jgi:hypothetical protein
MKHAVEMGSSVMIYITNFIKIGSGIQTLIWGGGAHRHTDSMVSSYAYFYFFQNNESSLIICFDEFGQQICHTSFKLQIVTGR